MPDRPTSDFKRFQHSSWQVDFHGAVAHDEQTILGGIGMLEFECPECRARMPYVALLAGRRVFCLGCGSHILVPNCESSESLTQAGESPKPIVVDVPAPREAPQNASDGSDPNAASQ